MNELELRRIYLDLVKRCVLNDIQFENAVRHLYLARMRNADRNPEAAVFASPALHLAEMSEHVRRFMELGEAWYVVDEPQSDGSYVTVDYRNYCDFAHSMIGRLRMDNIEHCLDVIRADNVPGDLIETGVCRGGAVVFMRAYLAAYGIADRVVWCADSFCGLPVPKMDQDHGYDLSAPVYPVLAVSQEQVEEVFRRYDLLDDQVRFLKGWFSETLPRAPVSSIALLRLDGDLYESTMDSLVWLYPKLSSGGFVIVDDYYSFEPCRAAIADYLSRIGESVQIVDIDRASVYWRKA